jgi:hypothetical protein
MEIIKRINGCLTIRENVNVPTFVALFYILLLLLPVAANFAIGFKSMMFSER